MTDLTPHGEARDARDEGRRGTGARAASGPVAAVRVLALLLEARVPEIVAEWETLADEEPWRSLDATERRGGIGELAVALVDAALSRRGDASVMRRALHAAAGHGARRRTQGVPPELLLREFGMLREALWRVLQRAAAATATRGELDAIYALDLAIAHATRAALFGAHRDALAARGAWPAAIDALGDEDPLGAV